jgi:phosphatidylglycerol:prolipoprotein diacylglycerol transferase
LKSILCHLGPLPIRSYGVMMALAFLVGILIGRRRAAKAGLDPDLIIDLAFFVMLTSIAGARVAYVLAHRDFYLVHPGAILRIWDGGLALYGGVVVGVAVGLLFFVRRGVDPWRGADVVAPSLAMGVALGRIGCFLNGCCFGKPLDRWWGVVFNAPSAAAYEFPGVRLHPTQIYESLAALGIFSVLLAVERKKPYDGFLLWLFVILLATFRFLVDPLRAYESSSIVWGGGRFALTTNQLVGLMLIAVSVLFMAHLARKKRASPRR